jgi:YidC/Oxa1 family membrane protein insertase
MYSFAPIALGLKVASTAVTALTVWLTPMAAGAAPALAIVVLTAAARLLLLPLTPAQVRGERDRNRLAPKLRELQRRHGKNRERIMAETQKLYAEAAVSPLAGCLPALAQIPVFMTLYGLFITPEIGGEPNSLLTATVAGAPLGSGPLDSPMGPHLPVFAVLLAVLVALAWAQRHLIALPALKATGAEPGAGMARIAGVLPFAPVAIAPFVPLAAGIYLATTTAWTLGERLILRRIVAP